MARKTKVQTFNTSQEPQKEIIPDLNVVPTVVTPVVEKEVTPVDPTLPKYNNEFEEFYYKNAKSHGCDYFHKGEWQKNYARFIQNVFSIAGKAVLDLGCAAGQISSAFKDNGAGRVVGIDASKFLTKYAPKNIEIKNGMFWDILNKEEPNQFDFIHSSHALSGIPEVALSLTMEMIKNVAKDGAIIFITGDFKNKDLFIKVAGDLGMKDGSKGYNEILLKSGNFMQEYKWDYLVLKVVK